MSRSMACALCGIESPTVRVVLVEWREPVDGQRWSAVPRCPERAACRKRVEDAGEAWEVREPDRAA